MSAMDQLGVAGNAEQGQQHEGAVGLSSDSLAELLATAQECGGILTLDCRSFISFNKSHIVGAANITCPTLLLKRLQQRSKKRRPSQIGRGQCVLLEKLVASQQEVTPRTSYECNCCA